MTRTPLVRLALSIALLVAITSGCKAETVDVKYRGPVDLAPFKCTAVDRSKFHSARLLRSEEQLHDRAAQRDILPLLRHRQGYG